MLTILAMVSKGSVTECPLSRHFDPREYISDLHSEPLRKGQRALQSPQSSCPLIPARPLAAAPLVLRGCSHSRRTTRENSCKASGRGWLWRPKTEV